MRTKEEVLIDIGKNIRKYRSTRTQGELAKQVSITQAYLSQLEHGKRAIHLNTLIKLADVFGIHPGILLLPDLNASKLMSVSECISFNTDIYKC